MILTALMLGLLLVYYQSYSSIVKIWWRSETFAHGFLVAPVSAYLIWKKRRSLARLVPHPSLWGLFCFFLLVLFWSAAHIARIQVGEQLAVVAMLPAVLWAVAGGSVVRRLVFPLAYLIFAVPMGEVLVPHLQDITADIVVTALRFTDVPVLREGRFIAIPSGNFEVAEACSGIRYLIASLALGSLYAYFSYRSIWRRLLFVALSLLMPVIANGLRAYGIIMLADMSDYRLAMGVDHIIYGWVFFGIVMALLFWLGSKFREPGGMSDAVEVDVGPAAGVRSAVVPLYISAAVLAGVALSGPAAVSYLSAVYGALSYKLQLPKLGGEWEGPFAADNGRWQPRFHGASEERLVEYRNGGERVQLYLALYTVQEQGAELVNALNSFYNPNRWRRVAGGRLVIPVEKGQVLNLQTLALTSPRTGRALWYWYEVGSVPVSDDLSAKIRYIVERFMGRAGVSLAVLVSHEHDASEGMSDVVLQKFLKNFLPPVSDKVIKQGDE